MDVRAKCEALDKQTTTPSDAGLLLQMAENQMQNARAFFGDG